MDVDLKLASRVTGIDAILGGHTHDGVPRPVPVKNAKGTTLVTNAGSNGKFLAVLELDADKGGVKGYDYRLLPVFSNVLDEDPEMAALIAKHRKPYEAKLAEKLAVSEGLLYRRGNFNGTLDQVILDALLQVKGTEIAFSPGFRWGTSVLPGAAITTEDVMNATAITYPFVTVNELTGENIKTLLEDICDNLFNPDPYYQQGGDMVRIGGMRYACDPSRPIGSRITAMELGGKLLEAGKRYKVASWAPVAEGATGEPVWDVVTTYLRSRKTLGAPTLNRPALEGVRGNPGLAAGV
jgi:sulfur-oxidizing protein SoxB